MDASTVQLAALAVLTLMSMEPGPGDDARYQRARDELVREIEADVRRTREYLGTSSLDPRVLEALGRVPRHEFVPEELRDAAYLNRPLPIGNGQTISQPYVVAVMTQLLELAPDARVLEVGTGSGYQAAMLAEVAGSVYSVEIVEPLGLRARALLERLGYDNVEVRIGDGFAGWPEQAPYDGIIVTAAAPEVPPPLLEQLAPGGRMILPLGRPWGAQELVLIEKSASGEIAREDVLPVQFVPLTRGPGDTAP